MFETPAPRPNTSVGVDVPRVEAAEKVTGAAIYASDMIMPGMLYAKVKVSPHARAKILSIDTSKAEALPGVRAVLVGSELNYKLGPVSYTHLDVYKRQNRKHSCILPATKYSPRIHSKK